MIGAQIFEFAQSLRCLILTWLIFRRKFSHKPDEEFFLAEPVSFPLYFFFKQMVGKTHRKWKKKKGLKIESSTLMLKL